VRTLVGKPVSKAVRATWSLAKLILETRKLIRTDYGGKPPLAVILKKAQAKGLNWGLEDVEFAHELSVDQVAGCRKRVKHNFDELLRRFNGA
jgi:hypothetical protein